MERLRPLIAEAIGTFALTFVGVAAISNGAGLVGIAFAHGLAIAVMISALGAISGGHFNPAVTFGLMLAGKIDLRRSAEYWGAQLMGAVVAALAIKASLPAAAVVAAGFGTPAVAEGVCLGGALLVEAILTFFLVTVVYGTAVDSRAPKVGGLFIGLAVTLDILAGGPLTGAAMNPARAFGPALIGSVWANHWVYWVGPLVGGGAAGWIYRNLFERA